jgi:hypothetical protein
MLNLATINSCNYVRVANDVYLGIDENNTCDHFVLGNSHLNVEQEVVVEGKLCGQRCDISFGRGYVSGYRLTIDKLEEVKDLLAEIDENYDREISLAVGKVVNRNMFLIILVAGIAVLLNNVH